MRRVVLLAALLAPLVLASPAAAGTYDIASCDAAGGATPGWGAFANTGAIRAALECPSNGDPRRGIVAANNPGAGAASYGTAAWTTFSAPVGAKVVGLTYTGGFWRPGSTVAGADDYTAAIQNTHTGEQLDGCSRADGVRCHAWATDSSPRSIAFAPADAISTVVACSGLGRCRESMPWSAEFGNHTAAVQLRSAWVRISDGSTPAVSIVGGSLIGGWVRGTATVRYDATDNVGIRTARVRVDGAEVAAETLPCEYIRPAPCHNAHGRELAVDTTRLADGMHSLRVDAVDPAANAGSATRTIRVDNLAPTVEIGGVGNPATPHPGPVVVRLSARDGGSGVDHVAYRVDSGAWVQAAGDDAQVPVSEPGAHTIEWYAVDAAGNRSASTSRPFAIATGPAASAAEPSGFAERTVNPVTFQAAPRFGEPCPAAATLVASRDAAVRTSDPDGRYGGAGVMDGTETFVGFPLPATPDCTVESARLRLYAISPGGVADVARASSAWNEPDVNWSTRPGGVGAVARANVAAGWVEWDVTEQVQGMYRHGDNGLRLTSNATVRFCAREGGEADCDDTRRPQLILRFAE